jgi:hypothetical protein
MSLKARYRLRHVSYQCKPLRDRIFPCANRVALSLGCGGSANVECGWNGTSMCQVPLTGAFLASAVQFCRVEDGREH